MSKDTITGHAHKMDLESWIIEIFKIRTVPTPNPPSPSEPRPKQSMPVYTSEGLEKTCDIKAV